MRILFLLLFFLLIQAAQAQLPVAPNQYQPQGSYSMGVAPNLVPMYVPSWIGAHAITATVTLNQDAHTLQTVSAAAGAVVVTLPSTQAPTGAVGKTFVFKAIDISNSITIAAKAGDTIDGAATIALTTLNQAITLESDGTHVWRLINNTTGGGGGGTPGGTSGQIQYNNAGSFGGFTASGDATVNTGTGAVAVTKTGGVSFAPSATTDTTNATNITSGTIPAARLPLFSSGANGAVPASGGGTTNFLRADGTFAAPSGASPGANVAGNPLQLQNFRSAAAFTLQQQNTIFPKVLEIGDSITGATQSYANFLPDRFVKSGLNSYPYGVRWCGGADLGLADYTIGAGWTNPGGFGPQAKAGIKGISGTASGNVDFVDAEQPTNNAFQIFYTCTATGASAALEAPPGFSAGTLTPTAGTISSLIVGGQGSTVRVKPPTGTGDVTIVGILPYFGQTNYGAPLNFVSWSNAGASGTRTSDWLPGITSLMATTSWKLVTINLMTNDIQAGTPAATWKSNMQTIITAAQTSGADVVLYVTNPVSGAATLQAQYETAAIELGQTNNCLVVDIYGRWISYANAVTLGFSSGDPIHPTAVGQQDITNAAFEPLAQVIGMRLTKPVIDLANDVGGQLSANSITSAAQTMPIIGQITPNSATFTALTSTGVHSNNSAITTVAGSAGDLKWSMPEQGTGYKKLVVSLAGYTAAGTTTITFPTAFARTPGVTGNTTGLSPATPSTTQLVVPISTTATGTITVEGF